MREFVLDASVALAWFLDHPVPAYAARVREALLRGDRAVVPALWHLEVANGLVVAERRRLLPASDAQHALAAVELLARHALRSLTDLVSSRQAHTVARTFALSAYDAVYLQVARQFGLPLATLDRALIAAAQQAKLAMFR